MSNSRRVQVDATEQAYSDIIDRDELQRRLAIEEVRLLFTSRPLTIAMAPVLAIIVLALLWTRTDSQYLLVAWALSTISIYLVRAGQQRFFQQAHDLTEDDYAYHGRWVVTFAAITGTLWGLLAYLPLHGDMTYNVALIAIVIGGTTSSAVTTLAVHRWAAVAFIVPSLGLLAVRLATLESAYGIGVMLAVYAIVAFSASRSVHRSITDNLKLRLISEFQEAHVSESKALIKKHQLLQQTVARAQTHFIGETDMHTLFSEMLADILLITQSQFGLIGQVEYDKDGNPVLHTYAIGELSKTAREPTLENVFGQRDYDIDRPDSLVGSAMATHAPAIDNAIIDSRLATGLPEDLPHLKNLMAAPLLLGGHLAGVLVLGNRDEPFDEPLLEYLAPLLSSSAQIIHAHQAETARRSTAKALDNMHAQLSAFIANTPVAVAMFDTDLRFVAYTQRFLSDFALDPSDFVGQSLFDVLPDLPQLWRESYALALEGQPQMEEADPYIRRDGTVRWFRWEARPWYKDNEQNTPSGVVLYCEDVTESKRAIDAIHARDQLLSKLTERIPGMLFQFRQHPNREKISILYISAGAADLYGRSLEELADNADYIFKTIHPDDLFAVRVAVDNVIREGGMLQIEHRICVQGQPERWIHVEAVLERLADASIIWHGYTYDITDRKQAEQRINDLAIAIAASQGDIAFGGQ